VTGGASHAVSWCAVEGVDTSATWRDKEEGRCVP
jgi:hypothetical protein